MDMNLYHRFSDIYEEKDKTSKQTDSKGKTGNLRSLLPKSNNTIPATSRVGDSTTSSSKQEL